MRVVDDLFSLHPRTVFLRREALAGGYEDGDLRNLRRAGVIRSVRHGAYVSAEVHDAADELERFRLRGQAVVLSHGGRVALSHTSAAAELGIALFRPDLRHVHVVRREAGHGAIESGIRYHRRVSTGIEEHPGLAIVTPVEAALGAASQHGVEQGLVATDSLIDLGLATLEQLHEAYARRAHHPHSRHLRIVVRLTREGAQSPLETRVRYFLFRRHLPEPELQVPVHDADGRHVGTPDLTWRSRRALGEIDGQTKYGPLLLPGQDVREVVRREKEREDAMREASQSSMIRCRDLHVPDRTEARVRRVLRL